MLGAGIDSLWVRELPTSVSLFLMLRVAGADYEFEEASNLEVRLVGPDAAEASVLEMGFSLVEMPPLRLPGMDLGILLPAVTRWEAEEFGLHTLEVFLADSRQRTIALYVRPVSELAGEDPAS
jgi:hypothetical protein